MVYCGAPSKGCERCRKRKIRCSQQPDGCSQCARANEKCPGYRAQVDVIFRQETDNVVRKAKARAERVKQAKSKSPRDGAASDSTTPEVEDSLEVVQQKPYSISLGYNMVPAMEDIATGFFIQNYIIGMQPDGPTKGHLDNLLDFKASAIDEGLLASMRAVGMAGFAHASGARSLMVDARAQYLKAIQFTNTALQSNETAKRDSTIMGIMILGIFEGLTGLNLKSLEAWAQHINGAGALLKLRGREQLATPGGRRVFIQVISSLIVCCIQRQLPMPAHIVQMTHELNSLIPTNVSDNTAWRVLRTTMEYAQFRADLKNEVITNDVEILKRALEIDGILQGIFADPPRGWEYQVVFTEKDPDIVWNGQYHVYYDYWVAQIWNSCRSIRVLLNMLIRNVLLRGFSAPQPLFTGIEHTAQYQVSTDTIYQLQADILHSVPQHIGYVNSFNFKPAFDPDRPLNPPSCEEALSRIGVPWSHSTTIDARSSQFGAHRAVTPRIRASGGYFLFWHLWFAGILEIATDEIRIFVIRNLEMLADKMGIMHARVLANSVRTKMDIFPD